MSRWRELADKRRRAHAGQISPTVMRAQPPAAADARHLQAGKTRAPNAAMPKMPELPKIESPNVFGNFGNSGAGVAAKIRGTRSLTYWPCGIARSPIGPSLRHYLTPPSRAFGSSGGRRYSSPRGRQAGPNRGRLRVVGCAGGRLARYYWRRRHHPAVPRDEKAP
jgi:hypothetical protein